mmetsp:Transcript_27196/g.42892  ORF Transcript_27196/g.42892 Transcript_27196/m.42892 type:complete len:252 (+) Transcript_27196:1770-2525(+)
MCVDALGRLQSCSQEEGGPVDGVEAQDVLPHDVQIRGPEPREVPATVPRLGVPERRDVVRQRVDPHVHDVVVVAGHTHAPVEGRPRHGQVLQAALHEGDHLVPAGLGRDEVRVALVELQQAIAPLRQLEEVRGLLHHPLHVRPGGGLPVHELALGVVGLVAHAVPALVRPQVDLALRHQLIPKCLHSRLMLWLRGADEAVRGEVHGRHQVPEVLRHPVRELLRGDAGLLGALLDLLPMLVGAGEEFDIVSI